MPNFFKKPLQKDFSSTQKVIETGLQAGHHLGAQVYISYQGELVADLAMGQRKPGVALKTDDLMLWLSSGKPILAVGLAQLWEKGVLDLDKPIAEMWPEFGQFGKEVLTVRHLLTHTAGIRGADLLLFDKLSWEETLEKICLTPREPNWIPEEKAGYHRSGSWIVLAEILQRLTQQKWQDYIRENVFKPIKMQQSHMGLNRAELEKCEVGEIFDRASSSPKIQQNYSAEKMALSFKPGSNALGPIRELGFFYEALLDLKHQEKLLKKETVEFWTRRHREGMLDQTFRQKMDWGLGFMLNTPEREFVDKPYHFGCYASDQAYGHAGAQSSFGFADPSYDLVVAWMFNGMPGEKNHHERTTQMNEAIYQDLGLV